MGVVPPFISRKPAQNKAQTQDALSRAKNRLSLHAKKLAFNRFDPHKLVSYHAENKLNTLLQKVNDLKTQLRSFNPEER